MSAISILLRLLMGLVVVAVVYGVFSLVVLVALGIHWFAYQEWAIYVVVALCAAAFGAGAVGADVRVGK